MAIKNVTLSFDERTLEEARAYAGKHGKSLNEFVRDVVRRAIGKEENSMQPWFELVDESPKTHVGRDWKREDLYDR